MKKTEQQIEANTAPNVQHRSFSALMLLAPLALLAATSAPAQSATISLAQSATPAAYAEPLAAAESPMAFVPIAASHPLQLGIAVSDESSSSLADMDLPEDPSVQVAAHKSGAAQNANQLGSPTAGPVAPIYTKYIEPGMTAQSITARDKVLIGLRDLANPLDFAAVFVSAGYEQVTNGQPNYGTDRGAFGERLGAAAIREATQGLFTDSVFSPLLREDPRYYIEGDQYGLVHRTLYAISRPLITRTDSGRSSVNGALLLGYAASSGLSYAYYPQINRNFRDTASTFGGGIGGAALGYFVSEFSSDVLQALHLEKKP